MEGFQPRPELNNDQTEPISASAPEKKRNIFMEQAEVANRSLDDLKADYRQARAEVDRITRLMSEGRYMGPINDLGDARIKVDELRKKVENHPDNKVTTVDYDAGVQRETDFNLHGNDARVFRNNDGSLRKRL